MRATPTRLAAMTLAAVTLVACATVESAPPSPQTARITMPPLAPSAHATSPSPTSPLPGLTPTTGVIAAGDQHTCVVTSGGPVRCWGSNGLGQLGNGTTAETATGGPVGVAGLESGVNSITAGGSHTCALTDVGGVKCWGSNEYGQLGDGSNADRHTPVDVVGLARGVRAISAGWSSTCALTIGGGVKCWGSNPFGGLGDGTTADSNSPVDVAGLASGVGAVATGTLHTCALTTGGGVQCWGYGQSDDPAVFTTSEPVPIPGLGSGTRAIAANLDRTCALMETGDVTCWGPNSAPSKDAGPPHGLVTVDVSGLAGGVRSIALGETHACAVSRSGGVGCWGDNSYGQLGSVTATDGPIAAPVDVPGLEGGVSAIALGSRHTCALTTKVGVMCWGSNDGGQLGSVTRCDSTSIPIDVALDPDAVTAGDDRVPGWTPSDRIVHDTGPTDVVLRFDRGPDFAVGDLVGELFQPGAEFTLYGDGTVIYRDDRAPERSPDGPIERASPFNIAHLDEDKVQSLLRFALGEGGLGRACERYESHDTDVAGSGVFTVHADGLDKRVEDFGSAPFGALADELRDLAAGGAPASVWSPDRYIGNLLDATIFKNIGDGLAPGLAERGAVPWPWPDIAPSDFVGLAESAPGRRVLSADEAGVLGLSDDGGVVKRIYLRAPKGKAIYYFSLWPMSPDETN